MSEKKDTVFHLDAQTGEISTEPPETYGYWIHVGTPSGYRYKCSKCGQISYYANGNSGRTEKDPDPRCSYKFCPHCGRRMKYGKPAMEETR